MSKRATIWVLFISALLVVLAVFFVVRSGRLGRSGGRQGTDNNESGATAAANPQSTILSPPTATGSRNPPLKIEGSWPMFRGGQGLLGRAPGDLADSLTLLWKFKTGAEVKSSAALQEGRVFIGSSDKHVYALDLSTGNKLWSYKAGGDIESAPCVVEGRVFVGSADDYLYALEAGTGELQWKYKTGGQILGSPNWTRSPDGQQAWILVGSYDNKVHCLEAQTGRLIWAYETGNYINGSPAVDDGQCVFGGCDAIIHVVSLADGSKVAEIDSGSYIAASAAFVDGEVYVGNYGNVFLRADLGKSSTGILPVSATGVSPVEADDRQARPAAPLRVGDGPATHGPGDPQRDASRWGPQDAHATAGHVVWEYSQSDAPFFSSPAVGEQLVVFGGRDGHVHGVRRDTGEKVWAFKTLGEVNSSPALCGDKVVVGSDDGRLYLLALADGKQLWSYEIGRPISSSPAVAGGIVVVGCDDGYVYAFGPKTGIGGETR